jgi:citrate lyase subunit beta/citryl-CoA lyase
MRSLLIVPGDSDRKLLTAAQSGADALLLDLEGSVALDEKPSARQRVAEYLAATRPLARRPRLYVRVNPFGGDMTEADLDAVMAAAPDGIMLTNSMTGADIERLGAKLAVREARHGAAEGVTRILAVVAQSARAIFGLSSYVGRGPRLQGIAWDADTLAANLGASGYRTDDGGFRGPCRHARELMLFAAAAVDTTFADLRDEAALRAECLAASRDGFAGKMAIHPTQIAVINEAFTRAHPPFEGTGV